MLLRIALLMVCLLPVACSDLDYYAQCATGHLGMMSKTRPIEEALADPELDERERQQLARVLEIRNFASRELALPDNGSYRQYADIERPYVVWNVVAAPEFSLEAKTWCFPFAGCVSYRGYFDQEEAEAEALALSEQGLDVDVYGVQAYSTLSWFDDPVLNTFLHGREMDLAALIFHELAHQEVYVAGDSSFNEAFAKAVEQEGLRRWLQQTASDEEWQDALLEDGRHQEFQALLMVTRQKLEQLYVQPYSHEEMRLRKEQILEAIEEEFAALSADWPDRKGYEAWMARGLNNARLANVATYYDLVPAFRALLASQDGELKPFYAEVSRLSELPQEQRLAYLKNIEKTVRHARVQEAPVPHVVLD